MQQPFLHPLVKHLWLQGLCVLCLSSLPVNAADPLDGFRDVKFGMTQNEIKQLTACSTALECMYELSNKNRYVQLTYATNHKSTNADSADAIPRLSKITIDMGHFTDEWYQQLQMILSNSYRLTHDFTKETMEAFLKKQSKTLTSGYENGQVLLTVARRPFGNLVLKVIYQDMTLARDFIKTTGLTSENLQ